jgi:hypothetical protein
MSFLQVLAGIDVEWRGATATWRDDGIRVMVQRQPAQKSIVPCATS